MLFYNRFIVILLMLFLPSVFFAQDHTKLTAVMEKVIEFYKKHPHIEGNFVLKVNNSFKTGHFYYAFKSNSLNIKMLFAPENVSLLDIHKYSYWMIKNNKLWIYMAFKKILVEQSIPKYLMSLSSLGRGLNHYFAEYKKFSTKNLSKDGEDLIQITFTEPKKDQTFSKVILEITKDGFQQSSYAEVTLNKKVKNFSFIITNVKFTTEFDSDKLFRINIPEDVQIIRNVLLKN